MGDESTATETAAPEQAPETGTTTEAEPAPIQLPDDHPLVKSLKATREELKAVRDAEKTDLQRVTDDLASEKTRSGNLETELNQLRSALKHGIDLEDVDLLGTGTPEEIEGRAKRLASRTAGRKKQGNRVPNEGTPSQPKPDELSEFTQKLFGRGD